MVNPKNRRFLPKKLIVVNADFQFRYVRIAILIGIGSTIVTSFALLYPLYVFEFLRIPKYMPAPIIWGVCVAILLNIASISAVGLLISHKIAGPMYAICRRLRSIEVGDWSGKVTLRKSDELGYIARNLNRVVDSLKYAVEKDIESIDEVIQSIESTASETDIQKLQALRERFNERIFPDSE